jgi:hypothetical protein
LFAQCLRAEPNSAHSDPDLARVMAAWPTLPAPIRRAVLALVDNGDPAD